MIIITFDFGVDKGAQFKSKRGGIHTVHTVQVSIALFYTEYWCLFFIYFFVVCMCTASHWDSGVQKTKMAWWKSEVVVYRGGGGGGSRGVHGFTYDFPVQTSCT